MIGEQDTLRIHFDEGADLTSLLTKVEGLEPVSTALLSDASMIVTVNEAAAVLPAIISLTATEGLRVRSIDIDEPNLETVFLHLTGRRLRE